MYLNCETILDFYTHKDKKVLCQIKVDSTSSKFKISCRSLTQEHWKTFDKELERLINTIDDWNDDKSIKFNIKPYIVVKVQKSKLLWKHFHKSLGTIGDYDKNVTGELADVIVFECLLDFLLDVPLHSTMSQEYEPQYETSPDGKLCSLSYKPYTPTKKKTAETANKISKCSKLGSPLLHGSSMIPMTKPDILNDTSGTDFLETNDDTYSPQPLIKIDGIKDILIDTIPKYTPAPINAERRFKLKDKLNNSNIPKEVIDKEENKIVSSVKIKSMRKTLRKAEIEYIPICHELTEVKIPVYIPTPIENQNTSKSENIRKNKKRSNTIDTFSKFLEENSNENYTSNKEQLNSRGKGDNKMLKKRSMTIDEIPTTLEYTTPVYIPTPAEDTKIQNVSKAEAIIKNKKRFNAIDDFSELVGDHTKKTYTAKREQLGTREKRINNDNKRFKLLKTIDKAAAVTVPQKSKEINEHLSPNLSTTTTSAHEIGKNSKTEIIKSCKNPQQSNDSSSILNVNLLSGADSSGQKELRKEEKLADTQLDSSLRRSKRSPGKFKRFIEEQPNLLNKNNLKKHKLSPNNKELFGTDDDDDDDNCTMEKLPAIATSITEESIQNSCSTSSSSTNKKRKRDKCSEYKHKKRGMSKSLSTEELSFSNREHTKASNSLTSKVLNFKTSTRLKSQESDIILENYSAPITLELPSKAELESIRNKTKLIQRENAKIRAKWHKMSSSPPKEVEVLSLQNMDIDEILNTFPKYKSKLDEIYRENRKRDYVKGYDGINHCFVIRLLPANIQMKMLEKLSEVYSKMNSTSATLLANALLPEWLIGLFMEEFNFTRHQAIDQIKVQNEFQLQMEEQSDNSLIENIK